MKRSSLVGIVRKILNSWVEFRYNYRIRYVPYKRQLTTRIKNRHIKYSVINLKQALNYKRSDTLFVIGSGPSIKDISPEQWDLIGVHDSLGINFSFLLDFIPTFHYMEFRREAFYRDNYIKNFSPKRGAYSDTIWFVHSKEWARLMRPCYVPEYFPESPICCLYKFPPIIWLDKDRPFTKEDFGSAILYRGSLPMVLYLALKLEYKEIVLLGIDPDRPRHFFNYMSGMREYIERIEETIRQGGASFSENAIPRAGKYRVITEYIEAVNEFVIKPRGVKLYLGQKKASLPGISNYWDGE